MSLPKKVIIYVHTYFLEAHAHCISMYIVGVGKEGRTLIGPWGYLDRKLELIELLP